MSKLKPIYSTTKTIYFYLPNGTTSDYTQVWNELRLEVEGVFLYKQWTEGSASTWRHPIDTRRCNWDGSLSAIPVSYVNNEVYQGDSYPDLDKLLKNIKDTKLPDFQFGDLGFQMALGMLAGLGLSFLANTKCSSSGVKRKIEEFKQKAIGQLNIYMERGYELILTSLSQTPFVLFDNNILPDEIDISVLFQNSFRVNFNEEAPANMVVRISGKKDTIHISNLIMEEWLRRNIPLFHNAVNQAIPSLLLLSSRLVQLHQTYMATNPSTVELDGYCSNGSWAGEPHYPVRNQDIPEGKILHEKYRTITSSLIYAFDVITQNYSLYKYSLDGSTVYDNDILQVNNTRQKLVPIDETLDFMAKYYTRLASCTLVLGGPSTDLYEILRNRQIGWTDPGKDPFETRIGDAIRNIDSN